MDLHNPLLLAGLLLTGIVAGVMSGLVGIGGGVIIVPIFVFFFGFSQHLAQGTTLAVLIPPVGLLAAFAYYRAGQVNLPAAMIVAAGFVVGGYLGARYAVSVSNLVLQRIFGAAMLVIALRMLIGSR